MRVAASPECRPEDLVTPGHVFPLKARTRRRARAHRSDRRLGRSRAPRGPHAGRRHLRDHERGRLDGAHARSRGLREEARPPHPHDRRSDPVPPADGAPRPPRRREDASCSTRRGTEWGSYVYESATDGRQFLALVKGDDRARRPDALPHALRLARRRSLRVHAAAKAARTCARPSQRIEAEGAGIVVYLPTRGTVAQRPRIAPHRARRDRAAAIIRSASSASARRCSPISALRKIAPPHEQPAQNRGYFAASGSRSSRRVPLVSMGEIPKAPPSTSRIKGTA